MTKKLMLDAGHGLPTPGRQTLTDPPIKEWILNQAVINFISANLLDYDVEIKFSHDPTGITEVPLATRVERCNEFMPDLFVSIHHNAFEGEWGNHTGVEVYYRPYGTVEDKEFAELVAPKLSMYTGLRNRGVKTAGFIVLTCQTTAVLCEGGFMDSIVDQPVITSIKGQQEYARAVSDSIIEFLDLKEKPSGLYHTVIKGESLWLIAQKYGITVAELKVANNLTSDVIYIDQQLLIPELVISEDQENTYHTVVKGDSLWSISQIYGVTVQAIKEVNNLTSDVIYINQKLYIPEVEIEENVNIIYVVEKGDNLWTIAQKFGVTVEALKALNNLKHDVIYIGQNLIIPNQPELPTIEFDLEEGQLVTLNNVPLFLSSDAEAKSGSVSGIFYIWGDEILNYRIRITNSMENVGEPGQVTGWINIEDIST